MIEDIAIHLPDRTDKSPPNMHEATQKNKITVASLKSFGHTHEEIATYLDIDHDTLVKHYKSELDKACVKANSAVANVLYKKAIQNEELAAVIFWLKTRAGWKEAKDKDENDKMSVIGMLLKELADKEK